jgi:hypothetical protein
MKKVVLFLISITLLTSCGTIHEMEKESTITGFDLTKYSNKGFLFTTETYNGGEYEAVGFLVSKLFPKISSHEPNTDNSKDYTYFWAENKKWWIGKIDLSEAIDSMYATAVHMGANAIIKFNWRSISKRDGILDISGYEVSGFAIKRIK